MIEGDISAKVFSKISKYIILTFFSVLLLGFFLTPAHAAAKTGKLMATGRVDSYNGLNIRTKPTTHSKVVKAIGDNKKIYIYEEVFATRSKCSASHKWYRMKDTKGRKGYVRSDYVDHISYKNKKEGTVCNVSSSANIRKGPGTAMKRVGTIKKGAKVTVVGTAKSPATKWTWYKIKKGFRYYYLSGKRIKFDDSSSSTSEIIEKEPVKPEDSISSEETPVDSNENIDNTSNNEVVNGNDDTNEVSKEEQNGNLSESETSSGVKDSVNDENQSSANPSEPEDSAKEEPKTPVRKPIVTYSGRELYSSKVTIGQATSGEHGKLRNCKAGDQSGKEVSMTKWTYSSKKGAYNNWRYVYRAKDNATANKIASTMKAICNNNHVGYDQNGHDRGTLYDEAKKVGWDVSKITRNCETTCASVVPVCLNAAGISAPRYMDSSKTQKYFKGHPKFSTLTSSKYTKSSKNLQPGDILVSPGRHTCIVVSSPNVRLVTITTYSTDSGVATTSLDEDLTESPETLEEEQSSDSLESEVEPEISGDVKVSDDEISIDKETPAESSNSGNIETPTEDTNSKKPEAPSKSGNNTKASTVKSLSSPKVSGKSHGYRRCDVSWSKESNATGYCVNEYDTKTKKSATYTVTSPNTVSYKFYGKVKNRNYQYKVQSYRTEAGKIIKSNWSNIITIKAKPTYIGQASADRDHKLGDSSGKEVAIGKWTYSKKHQYNNWTYVFRFKDPAKAEKAAHMMEVACKNNNIGYNKKAGSLYRACKPYGYDMSKVKKKVGGSCGDVVTLCIRYSGINCKFTGSGLGVSKDLKSRTKDFTCLSSKKYTSSDAYLQRGDILITAHSNGKGNHVCMVL